MTDILICREIFYGIIGIGLLSTITAVCLGFLILTIPEIGVLIKAQTLKRPIVQIHTALKQTKLYAPKREGKKHNYNRYDLPLYGTKFTPLPEMVEHAGAMRHINFYSKASLGLEAKAIAAFRDVETLLKTNGINPTESILDVIITMTDDEIDDLYEIDAESLDNMNITLKSEDVIKLRTELQNAFIKDGQFVWETAKNFVFLMQTETARSLDESIAIAREQAIDDARLGNIDKSTSMTIIYIITLLMGGVIAYRMLTG